MSEDEEDKEAGSNAKPAVTTPSFTVEKKKPGRKPNPKPSDSAAVDSEEEPANLTTGGLVKRSQGGYVKKQHKIQTLPTPGLV